MKLMMMFRWLQWIKSLMFNFDNAFNRPGQRRCFWSYGTMSDGMDMFIVPERSFGVLEFWF